MVQQKSDNKPSSETKLLKFTARDRQDNSERSACPEPADMIRLAVELGLFDSGSAAAHARLAEVSSIQALALPMRKSPLQLRDASLPEAEVTDLAQASSQPQARSVDKQKKKNR